MVKSYYYIPDDVENIELVQYSHPDDLPLDVPYLVVKLGQSDIENSKLVSKASQKDWWFHLANAPSPHALTFYALSTVENHNLEKDSNLKNLMAEIVKQHSKQKFFKTSKLHYCQRKNLKLGDKPGLVLLKKTPSSLTI